MKDRKIKKKHIELLKKAEYASGRKEFLGILKMADEIKSGFQLKALRTYDNSKCKNYF